MDGVNHTWLETKLMKQNFTWLTRAKKLVLTEKFFSSTSYFSTLCIIILLAEMESYSCLICRIESAWQLVRFKEDLFLRIKK